jgi:thymidylate kinase
MNKFFAFEGVDGAGKTTLAEGLAKRTSGFYIKTPGSEYKPTRPYIDNGVPPLGKLLYYLSSVVDASKHIESALKQGPVFCDRYIWSSLIPHASYHDRELAELEQEYMHVLDTIAQPTNVLVEVAEAQQLERLDIREDAISASDVFCLDTQKRRKVRDLYEVIAVRGSWVRIDTTDRDPNDAMEELQERLALPVIAGK